jgi:hypothetical protein
VTAASYELVFYADAKGREPVAEFIEGLAAHQRAALLAALEVVLAEQGIGVVGTQHGKALGRGLYEFRLRHTHEEIARRFPAAAEAIRAPAGRRQDPVLLRVFFHPYGRRLILLLSGYDKGRDDSSGRQEREIARDRRCLSDFRASERQKQGRRG